ncbi:MAG: transglutaminase-like domain-containing protein, partial [Promethearchaeia archaeon]
SSEPVQPQIAPGYLSDYVSKNQVWDYEFVARYSISDLQTYGGLPPGDAMSSMSGNPDYYWEGLDNDGFSISPSCSAYHPTMWPIIYQAGYLVDNSISYPEYSTETLIIMVHSLMTYQENADTLETTNSDMYTYNYNWIGVCDEFAVVLSSFLRAINIPCRYIYGKGTLLGDETAHAWCEAYVSGFWKHCDPTWNKFDQPWIYEYSFFWLEEIWIFSGADDSLHYDSNDLNDGGNYNGKLHYWFDFTYRVGYDGPNAY